MTNLQAFMNKKTFVPLAPGVHEVTIKDWTIRTSRSNDSEDYIQVTFAPSNNLEHEHNTALFASEKVNTLQTFINNLQRVLNLPGATVTEVLNASRGVTVPATFETVTKEGKRYFNWHLGYERPALVESTPTEETGTAPERRRRA